MRRAVLIRRPIRATTGCLLVLASLLPGTGGRAQTAPDSDPCGGQRGRADEVTVPSLEHRTIQSGICAVVDGGTVHLLAGTYSESVTIWGKHVVLRGTGNADNGHGWPVLLAPAPTDLVPSADAIGVVSVRAGGSLTGRMLQVFGGDAGILVDETSGPVALRHTRFDQNGRGILHLSSRDLTIKHAEFTHQVGNGISYAPKVGEAGNLFASHVAVLFSGGMGFYADCGDGGGVVVTQTTFAFDEGGGIGVAGCLLIATDIEITHATKFGILAQNGHAIVEDTVISQTHSTPEPDEFLGDAIVVWTAPGKPGPKPARADLARVHTDGSDRVSLSNFGAVVSVYNCTFRCDGSDIEDWVGADQPGYGFAFEVDGVVECGCPDANESCIVGGSAPAPPEPIGGTE